MGRLFLLITDVVAIRWITLIISSDSTIQIKPAEGGKHIVLTEDAEQFFRLLRIDDREIADIAFFLKSLQCFS